MNHYKLYIFDWDGTLMDSIHCIVTAMQSAMKIAELPTPSSDDVKSIIGLSLIKAVQQLCPQLSNEECAEIASLYKQAYAAIDKTDLSLFEGTYALLETLHTQGKRLAIATGKSRDGLTYLLDKTNTVHFFESTKTVDEAKSKPDPDMIQQILSICDIEAHEAVMIGDASFDLVMANNAGVDSIAVTMGASTESALLQYEPTALVHSTKELTELIT